MVEVFPGGGNESMQVMNLFKGHKPEIEAYL